VWFTPGDAIDAHVQVAFFFNAFEDSFEAQGLESQNLWCSDPWKLLLACRPGMVRGHWFDRAEL